MEINDKNYIRDVGSTADFDDIDYFDDFGQGLSGTGIETLCKNQNSSFRLKTTGNTDIPVTNVRKKAGRIYSSCIFIQKV